MAPKRIVLTTHGTLGDLHPFLAIALELQRRGYKPVIATSEYHCQKVEAAGVEFHATRPDISFEDVEFHRRLTEPKRGMERIIREHMLPVLRETYDDLLTVIEKDSGADLLVSQILIFAAPLIAEKTGVPWISTELQPGAFMSAYDPPVLAAAPSLAKLRGLGPALHRPMFSFAKVAAHFWSKPIRELRRELNLPATKAPLFAGRNSPRLVLALFSSALAERQPDWPPNTVVTGFPFYDESESSLAPALETFLAEGEPPIIFTLGSSAFWQADNFFADSVSAARSLGQRALLLVGSSTNNPGNHSPDSLKDVFVADYASYAQIFPRGSVIVHQGGVGTTGQAMRAGKPMLVMPFGGDQYDNGARVARLGAGRTIMRKQYTAARAADELKLLLENHGYRERAAELSRRVQSENGVRAACDAIGEQLTP